MSQRQSRLVAHVIYRLHTGGLENGLVNIINNLPPDEFQHVVICIDTFTEFRRRIRSPDVPVIAVNKKPGRDPAAFFRLLKILRHYRPDIIHTRNLAGLDGLLPAFLARVPYRIHSEHGRDTDNLDGSNARHRLLRKLHRPLVHRFMAVSPDLAQYLEDDIGVRADRIEQIINGVDTERFFPANSDSDKCSELLSFSDGRLIVGTVGRLDGVKDQMNLVRSLGTLFDRRPELRDRLCIAIVGDGPSREEVEAAIADAELTDVCWLPGGREDIPAILRTYDVFVLPSLAEGISNTILEAMASGLPIVATRVGGNDLLVEDGVNGQIVPAADSDSLGSAIEAVVDDTELRNRRGEHSRRLVEEKFSLASMVDRYRSLYAVPKT
ncbi:MAG: TIGR03088 family PEP-CTERM/XrtA system glycosyltransferase [Woeseiaceae bacterium]|nr:TIGR03088 family PEP-CTERM/XrtA system glycosyltransferase [Woeseiaceae bacterium]